MGPPTANGAETGLDRIRKPFHGSLTHLTFGTRLTTWSGSMPCCSDNTNLAHEAPRRLSYPGRHFQRLVLRFAGCPDPTASPTENTFGFRLLQVLTSASRLASKGGQQSARLVELSLDLSTNMPSKANHIIRSHFQKQTCHLRQQNVLYRSPHVQLHLSCPSNVCSGPEGQAALAACSLEKLTRTSHCYAGTRHLSPTVDEGKSLDFVICDMLAAISSANFEPRF